MPDFEALLVWATQRQRRPDGDGGAFSASSGWAENGDLKARFLSPTRREDYGTACKPLA